MNIQKFQAQIERQGLARNSRWTCEIFSPRGLNSSIFTFGDEDLSLAVNLPGIDMIDQGIEQINNLSLDFPGLSFDSNLKIPTLGYTLRNQGEKLDSINLYCNMISLPERDLTNLEWREYGESRELGIVHEYMKGVSVSYYCSEDLRERQFFEQWQDLIFNPRNKNREYYENYVSTMEVTKYDTAWSNKTAVYKFNEVYPTNIAAQTLVYEGTSILRLDINFKFRNYIRIK